MWNILMKINVDNDGFFKNNQLKAVLTAARVSLKFMHSLKLFLLFH